MMAGPGLMRYLKDASDPAVALSGVAKTATFNSEWIPVSVLGDLFGLGVKLTSVSGTTPTLDVDLEWSPDGGTTVFVFPGTDNDPTQAVWSIQQTTNTSEPHPCEFWGVPLGFGGGTVDGGGSVDPVLRFEFTIGGTNPSFTIEAWLFSHVTS